MLPALIPMAVLFFQVEDQRVNDLNVFFTQPRNADARRNINAQDIVRGNPEQACQFNNILRGGHRNSHLPRVHIGTGDSQLLCQVCLRQSLLFP